jgi:AP-3 complex subunit sigma
MTFCFYSISKSLSSSGMIRCVLIFNEQGKARLLRFYDKTDFEQQQLILKNIFGLISGRDDSTSCCFVFDSLPNEERIIYRHFASLFFVVVADACESELGILDLLQVFVHVLDQCFENICELDIVYHYDRVNYVLDEIVMAGLVLETNSEVILHSIGEINRSAKAS